MLQFIRHPIVLNKISSFSRNIYNFRGCSLVSNTCWHRGFHTSPELYAQTKKAKEAKKAKKRKGPKLSESEIQALLKEKQEKKRLFVKLRNQLEKSAASQAASKTPPKLTLANTTTTTQSGKFPRGPPGHRMPRHKKMPWKPFPRYLRLPLDVDSAFDASDPFRASLESHQNINIENTTSSANGLFVWERYQNASQISDFYLVQRDRFEKMITHLTVSKSNQSEFAKELKTVEDTMREYQMRNEFIVSVVPPLPGTLLPQMIESAGMAVSGVKNLYESHLAVSTLINKMPRFLSPKSSSSSSSSAATTNAYEHSLMQFLKKKEFSYQVQNIASREYFSLQDELHNYLDMENMPPVDIINPNRLFDIPIFYFTTFAKKRYAKKNHAFLNPDIHVPLALKYSTLPTLREEVFLKSRDMLASKTTPLLKLLKDFTEQSTIVSQRLGFSSYFDMVRSLEDDFDKENILKILKETDTALNCEEYLSQLRRMSASIQSNTSATTASSSQSTSQKASLTTNGGKKPLITGTPTPERLAEALGKEIDNPSTCNSIFLEWQQFYPKQIYDVTFLKEFLPLSRCLESLKLLLQHYFGYDLQSTPFEVGEVWDYRDIKKFSLVDQMSHNSGPIGTIYLCAKHRHPGYTVKHSGTRDNKVMITMQLKPNIQNFQTIIQHQEQLRLLVLAFGEAASLLISNQGGNRGDSTTVYNGILAKIPKYLFDRAFLNDEFVGSVFKHYRTNQPIPAPYVEQLTMIPCALVTEIDRLISLSMIDIDNFDKQLFEHYFPQSLSKGKQEGQHGGTAAVVEGENKLTTKTTYNPQYGNFLHARGKVYQDLFARIYASQIYHQYPKKTNNLDLSGIKQSEHQGILRKIFEDSEPMKILLQICKGSNNDNNDKNLGSPDASRVGLPLNIQYFIKDVKKVKFPKYDH